MWAYVSGLRQLADQIARCAADAPPAPVTIDIGSVRDDLCREIDVVLRAGWDSALELRPGLSRRFSAPMDLIAASQQSTVFMPNLEQRGIHFGRLAAELRRCGWRSRANVYVTGGRAGQSSPAHSDGADVVALQLLGSKTWHVGVRSPYRWLDKVSAHERERVLDDDDLAGFTSWTTGPGDALFLPAGTPHYAENNTPSPSVHISFSATSPSLGELVSWVPGLAGSAVTDALSGSAELLDENALVERLCEVLAEIAVVPLMDGFAARVRARESAQTGVAVGDIVSANLVSAETLVLLGPSALVLAQDGFYVGGVGVPAPTYLLDEFERLLNGSRTSVRLGDLLREDDRLGLEAVLHALRLGGLTCRFDAAEGNAA